ncbi:ABC transporter permease [Altererythrobacter aquiaggeris]|uniref:ABC transporter permease n=1 Tax=Aestuarierythrobacter aquiaggeris TaxID=1898396 RepID=UPI00301AD13B
MRGAAIRSKEWAQIWRDPASLGLVIVLPLILIFLFGSAISLDTVGTATGLVDRDRTATSRDLVDSFTANRYFEIHEAGEISPLKDKIAAGGLRGIIVIPDGFEAAVIGGGNGRVQLIADGSQPNTAAFLDSHISGLLQNWADVQVSGADTRREPVLALATRYIYNPGLESRFMLVPGAIAIVMAMIGCLLTALVMAREYERGTMEGLLSTPLSPWSLVANKIAPYFVMGFASTALCVAVAIFFYGLPLRGSLFALVLIIAAFLAAVLAQGLWISSVTKNQFASIQMALLLGYLPSLLLSGFLFELDSMPVVIRWFSYLVPARYLIPPLQSVFLAGDIWSVFLPNIAILLAFGGFFMLRASGAIKRTIV